MNIALEVIGIIGGCLFLFSFWRVSTGKWTGKSLWYEIDNLLGAILLTYYALHKEAYINIFMNVVWGFVAIRGISLLLERRKKRKATKQKQKSKSKSRR